MIECLFTIGGYGFSESSFFRALVDARIDLFCDVRRRRGMRGSAFAFLNSTRLQTRLASLNIPYIHLKEFAPTESIRQRQKDADSQLGIQKRSREELSNEFMAGYRTEILGIRQHSDFFSIIPQTISRPCLFCVERKPEACHRSLMSTWLSATSGLKTVHLQP